MASPSFSSESPEHINVLSERLPMAKRSRKKKPPKGGTLPSRLLSEQNLLVTFNHVSLQKVRVMGLIAERQDQLEPGWRMPVFVMYVKNYSSSCDFRLSKRLAIMHSRTQFKIQQCDTKRTVRKAHQKLGISRASRALGSFG